MKKAACVLAALIWFCGSAWAHDGEKAVNQPDAAVSQAKSADLDTASFTPVQRAFVREHEQQWHDRPVDLGVPHVGSIFQAGVNPITPKLPGCGGEPFCSEIGTCCCCDCRTIHEIWVCVAIEEISLCHTTICQSQGD